MVGTGALIRQEAVQVRGVCTGVLIRGGAAQVRSGP